MNNKKMISCQRAAQLASKSLEKKLTWQELMTLKAHLAICKTCLFYYRQIKALRKVFQNYSKAICKIPPPKDRCLSPQSKARLKKNLAQTSP